MFLSDPHPQVMPVKVAVVGGNVWGKPMFTLPGAWGYIGALQPGTSVTYTERFGPKLP